MSYQTESMSEITYLDHMGDDLGVVNAARVSFGKAAVELTDYEARLIGYLARGCTTGEWEKIIQEAVDLGAAQRVSVEGLKTMLEKDLVDLLNHVRRMPSHWTPFGQVNVKLHMKMPICIARQWMRSTIGVVPNEISRRYVSDTPEFTHPELRLKAANVKQGSSDKTLDPDSPIHGQLDNLVNSAIDVYERMIERGVAPEVARFYLPQGVKTEIIANGTLAYWGRVVGLRKDPHAQKEVRDVADAVSRVIQPLFPVSWVALTA